MARLIDADALFRRTSKEMDCRKLYLPVDFQELVATEPTVDAEPVRHGRWVICKDGWGDTQYRCSACGDEWTLIDGAPKEYGMNYCPFCGAKMDGGENDGKAGH